MSVDPILGPMGTPLPYTVGSVLADADAATTHEQMRWSRASCLVTPRGILVRAVDLGHTPQVAGIPIPATLKVAGATCSVCGQDWPCVSSEEEQSATFGPSAAFLVHNVTPAVIP